MFVIKESASEQRSLVIRVFVIHLELIVYMRTNKVRENMKINVVFFSPSDCFSVQFLRKSNFNFIDTYKIDVTESQSNQYSNQFVSIT